MIIDSIINTSLDKTLVTYRLFLNLNKNKKCPICNKHYTLLNVHHINGDHNDNRIKNLTTCCTLCHSYIHRGIDKKNPCGEKFGVKRNRKLRNFRKSSKYSDRINQYISLLKNGDINGKQ